MAIATLFVPCGLQSNVRGHKYSKFDIYLTTLQYYIHIGNIRFVQEGYKEMLSIFADL